MWHHLAFHLTCLRTFSLTFYLLYIYTFHLAFFLTFLLAHVGVRVCPYSDLELAINIINLKFSACLCTGFEA